MAQHVIEFDKQCQECRGTGLYVGMAEKDGAAVVCSRCNGTGCAHVRLEYDDFTERRLRKGVTRVFQCNPGIIIGSGKDGQRRLEDFGGMDYADWNRGQPFPPRSENRQFTCPAWWYQTTNYDQKPKWKECLGAGSFSSCPHFTCKAKCWARFDAERQ